MTNLFAFTDPCEPMCDMCTPLEMTPIYVQLKAEYELDQTLARVNSTFRQAEEAMRQLGQGVRAAFVSFDELNNMPPRKPLLKNGKRR